MVSNVIQFLQEPYKLDILVTIVQTRNRDSEK